MSKQAIAPGSWSVVKGGRYIEDDNGNTVATVWGSTDETAATKARLIAAAPDLLDSLAALVELARMRGGKLHEYGAALDAADAAIAKATGEGA